MGDVIQFPDPRAVDTAEADVHLVVQRFVDDDGRQRFSASFPDLLCAGVGDTEAGAIESLTRALHDFVRGRDERIAELESGRR